MRSNRRLKSHSIARSRRRSAGIPTAAQPRPACRCSMEHHSGAVRGGPCARPTEPREDSADRTGVLGLEDAAERDRARTCSPSWRAAPSRSMRSRGRLGLHPRSARDFLDTLVALGFLTRERRPLRQHARDRPVPRPQEAVLRRRHPRDGEPPPLSVLGSSHRGAAHRAAAERSQGRRSPSLFETLYADPARLKEFLAAMTGISHGANMTIARQFPVEGLPHLRRRRHGAGRPGRADRARQPAPARASGSTCRQVAPIFEEYVAALGVADRLTFTPGDFFSDALPQGRRRADGPHPARLGSAHEEDADPEGVRRAFRTAAH